MSPAAAHTHTHSVGPDGLHSGLPPREQSGRHRESGVGNHNSKCNHKGQKESTRRRCGVGKQTGPASCRHVRTWALQIDSCLFYCGLWQLKENTPREENRSSDSYCSCE
ncbi:uncharacterized protein ACO6RY_06762 [Pungitius sinensis]